MVSRNKVVGIQVAFLMALLSLCPLVLHGQVGIGVFDFDTTDYPLMRAHFSNVDAGLNHVHPLISSLRLSENGVQCQIVDVLFWL